MAVASTSPTGPTRQLTTGRDVDLDRARTAPWTTVRALGVDAASGALVVEDEACADGERLVLVGEIRHVAAAPAACARPPRPMRRGCNAMARPALRRVGRPEERPVRASPTWTAIGPWWRRPGRTRPGSRPCIGSTSPRCTTSRSTSCATTTRRRTPRSGRSWPPSRTSIASRSAPRAEDGEGASTFRIWLFRIARNVVAERRRSAASPTRRRRLEAALQRGRPDRHRGVGDRPRGGGGRLAGRRSPARRPAPGDRPAVRPRDVDRGDRRRPRSLRGRRPGAPPSRPAHRSPATSGGTAGERTVRRARRRDRGARRRPLPRVAAGAPPDRCRRRPARARGDRPSARRRPARATTRRSVSRRPWRPACAAAGRPDRTGGEVVAFPATRRAPRRVAGSWRIARSPVGPRSSAAC